jgi:hypothetical protein
MAFFNAQFYQERTVNRMELTYPHPCRKSINRLRHMTGIDPDTLYSMMLMTAALMDLKPEDDQVAEIILADIGIFPEPAA